MTNAAAQIIEGKGGAAVFARAIGAPPSRVRVWKSRGIIPRASWPEISQAFPDLTTEALLRVEGGA